MSAFHLLKISPESSRAEIDNAHEEARFDARAPEDVLQKAVDALTAPMPRLREETLYLWGISLSEIDQLIHLAKTDVDGGLMCRAMEKMSLSALTKANLAMYFCAGGNASNVNNRIDVLSMLIAEQKHINAVGVGAMINPARKKSGVVPPAKLEDIKDALTKLREETYIKSAINVIFHVQHPGELATKIAEEWRFDKTSSGRLVADLIRGAYKNRIQNILRPLEQEIYRAVDVLRNSPRNKKPLRLIEQKLPEWDEYAQPIQLIDEGKGFDEQHSSKICDKLRNLAWYFHNEKGESRVSLRIIKLLNKFFSKLPETAKRLAKDLDTLERIVNKERYEGRLRALKRAVGNIQDDPDKILNLRNALFRLLNNHAELSNNEKIWNIARSAAVALHNKHGSRSAALNLTKKLLSLAKHFDAPQSIHEQLCKNENSFQPRDSEEISTLERSGATIFTREQPYKDENSFQPRDSEELSTLERFWSIVLNIIFIIFVAIFGIVLAFEFLLTFFF